VDDENILTGFNAGLCKIPVSKSFSIQPEIYYTTKGAEQTYNNVFYNGVAKFNINYIEVPVLVSYQFDRKFKYPCLSGYGKKN
jgi:hypothetical protein